jgi:hypothetical protein
MQGAQKLRSEAHLQVRRNDEVAAQRRRWTFYETINFQDPQYELRGKKPSIGFYEKLWENKGNPLTFCV